MRSLEWKVAEWHEAGKRHLKMMVNMRVRPYVRQTRGTRWRGNHPSALRAQEYNRVRGDIRDAVAAIMKAERIVPFRKTRLGFEASFYLKPKRVLSGKRWSWVDNPGLIDLGNLEKALEDALQGVLLPNDKWIWARGCGGKFESEEDVFVVHVWEMDPVEGQPRQGEKGE